MHMLSTRSVVLQTASSLSQSVHVVTRKLDQGQTSKEHIYIYIYILVIRKLDQRQTSKEHIYKYWKTPSWPWVDQRYEVYLGPVTLSDADLRWDSYIATEYHWPTRPARLSGSWWGAWRWVPWPSRTKESPAWLGRRLSSQAQSGTGRTRRRRR